MARTGSFFAGVKAGTLGGVLYIGGIAAFNAALLYAFKSEAITLITENNPTICPSLNMTSTEACFSSVVTVYLPYIAFIGFFVTLFFAGLFGWSYETFPGKTPLGKGMVVAAMVALGLVLGDLYGVTIGGEATALLALFFMVWTGVFGFVMARLYTRYTRTVRFESPSKLVKVLVDGKDFTGRTRTFAHTSTHEIRAEMASGAAFREWNVSGGVTVEDPRSFETLMEVNGDGMLRAQGVRKT